jgi:hypothetical protein
MSGHVPRCRCAARCDESETLASALLLARALSLIAAEASQSDTPAARTDKFREIHRNSPTTILYSYMVISQLDRRVNVAPMMDWSDSRDFT